MSSLRFRTVTVVEGDEIDAWLQRQEAIGLAADERDQIRWQTAYRLLGGTRKVQRGRRLVVPA